MASKAALRALAAPAAANLTQRLRGGFSRVKTARQGGTRVDPRGTFRAE